MNAAPVGRAPRTREWRRRFRRARRRHHDRSLGDVLTDLYMLLWLVLVYGLPLGSAVRKHASLSLPGPSSEALWITVGIFLAGAGVASRGFGALGPLLASPAEQSWAVSTPLDRRGWLLPRLTFLLLAVGGAFAVAAAAASLAMHAGGLGWTTLGAGAMGVALAGGSVVGQGTKKEEGRAQWASSILTGAGVLAVAAVVMAHRQGWALPSRTLPSSFTLSMVGVPLAGLAAAGSVRALPGIDLAALSAGAQLAAATVTATLGMDPSALFGMLEIRHWQRVGRVSSRPFRFGRLGRTWVLLEAEVRRQLRRPAVLGTWLGLAVAQYAVAILVPSMAGVAKLILAYVVANRFAAGLRFLSRSPGLRRSLGGDEIGMRITHMVIPTLGAALWWLATGPIIGTAFARVDLILVLGVAGASYRAATKPPLNYGGVVMETPFGLFPLELVTQMARGPDLLGFLIVLQWIVAR